MATSTSESFQKFPFAEWSYEKQVYVMNAEFAEKLNSEQAIAHMEMLQAATATRREQHQIDTDTAERILEVEKKILEAGSRKKKLEAAYRLESNSDHAADTATYPYAQYANWDSNKSRGHAKKMANKFLPFVVDNTPPLSIFKTLITRSKGLNRVLLASIFNLTLNVDIKTLRAAAKALPEMELEKIYEELMNQYPSHRVDGTILHLFETIGETLTQYSSYDPSIWDKDIEEFELKDRLLYSCVVSNTELEDHHRHCSVNFKRLNQVDKLLSDLPNNIQLSDSGEKVHVFSEDDLIAALMFYIVIHPQLPDVLSPNGLCIVMEKSND